MTEEQKKRKQLYDEKLHRDTLDRIVIQPRKTLAFPARLQKVVDNGIAPSRQAYIIQAIKAALDRDGITAPDDDQTTE